MAIQIEKHEIRSATASTATAAPGDATSGRAPAQSRGGAGPTKATPGSMDYARMVAKLSAARRDPASLNMLGVCHLRLGNIAEAVRIYRGLALQPGCTWERPEIPAVYKRNFATALLLAGLPGGCLSVLQSLDEDDQPRAAELVAAIKRWERSLSFLQRWDWRLNGAAPKLCHIPIDFEPGEFE